MTPTRKVKRSLMYERFKPLVEEMYDDKRGETARRQCRRRTRLKTSEDDNQALGRKR